MKLCANLSFMFQEEENLVARSVLILQVIVIVQLLLLSGIRLLTRLASVQWRWPTLTMRTWEHWLGSLRRLDLNRFSSNLQGSINVFTH